MHGFHQRQILLELYQKLAIVAYDHEIFDQVYLQLN